MCLTESIVDDASFEFFGELNRAVEQGPHQAPDKPAADLTTVAKSALVQTYRSLQP